jgi:ribosome-interacting GTPase 1
VQAMLRERKVSLVTEWPAAAAHPTAAIGAQEEEGDIFDLRLPTLLLANKSDLLADPETDVEVLAELEEPHFPTLLVSAETGQGLDELGEWLWRAFGLVRIYTKAPGKPAMHDRPFTLRHGEQTVGDVARLVHRDMAQTLKYARVWGASVAADGQHVGRDHVLSDRDVVELHA